MARCLSALIALVFMATSQVAPLMAASASQHHRVTVELVSDAATAVAGQTITVAVRERIEPGWHTYWINPGDSGEPTSVEWRLPEGVRAGPIQWPVPHTIPIADLTNYGYEGDLLLLSAVEIPADAPPGPLTIAAKVRLLVCKDICVPEETDVSLTLNVGGGSILSAMAGKIEEIRTALPRPFQGRIQAHSGSEGKGISLEAAIPHEYVGGIDDAHFFPSEWGAIANSPKQAWAVSAGVVALKLPQGESKDVVKRLTGLLVLSNSAGLRTGYSVDVSQDLGSSRPLQSGSSSGGSSSGTGGSAASGTLSSSGGGVQGAGLAVLFAFLGGLMLNLMPCVLPVLALKALSFSRGSRREHRRQGYAYLAGVLASFLVFAAVIAVLREGAAAVGWGFQFQSPVFVLVLAALFFAMGLSLSGVVSFGGGLMSTGDGLTRKAGDTGAFFTGVLAAVAATPCTAPFMGAALGYATTQPLPVLIAVLLGLGLGFAAPMVALSLIPGFQRMLPKPGHWMESLKQVLAFPLYATAGWLVWVLSIQAGSDGVLGAAVAFVGIGFAAWLADKTAFSSRGFRLVAPTFGVAVLLFAVSITRPEAEAVQGFEAPGAQLHYEPFTQARLDGLLAGGRPVFINLTAAWCITCKVNERVALKSAGLAKAFAEAGIVSLKGDWTKPNAEISALLTKFDRNGVPLYLFYPSNGGDPRVLPQILTESLVLEGIGMRSAGPETKHANGA